MLVTIDASAFSSSSLQTIPPTELYEAQWQISADAAFTEPLILDTWFQAVFLESLTQDLESAGVYIRVRYRDSLGVISDWSDPLFLSTLIPQETLERAWAFVLDGHIFYVLNFVYDRALIFDLTTEQWHRWAGQNVLDPLVSAEPFWNMFRGVVWKGRVLAAGMEDSNIWELDPHSFLDEETDPIERTVTGYQPLRGSRSIRLGSFRITARKEDVAQPSTLSMRYSDDNGQTWSTPRTVTLIANSYSQRLEFRSLGRVRAPGRIWEIADSGGFVRIEGSDADSEGGE